MIRAHTEPLELASTRAVEVAEQLLRGRMSTISCEDVALRMSSCPPDAISTCESPKSATLPTLYPAPLASGD